MKIRLLLIDCRKQAGKMRILLLLISAIFSSTLFAQEVTVTGRVASGDTALAGVTVNVKVPPTPPKPMPTGAIPLRPRPMARWYFLPWAMALLKCGSITALLSTYRCKVPVRK